MLEHIFVRTSFCELEFSTKACTPIAKCCYFGEHIENEAMHFEIYHLVQPNKYICWSLLFRRHVFNWIFAEGMCTCSQMLGRGGRGKVCRFRFRSFVRAARAGEAKLCGRVTDAASDAGAGCWEKCSCSAALVW